ncbi:MAG: hypothetical protein AAGF11_00500 [Myxococcota bacterium]
MRIRQLGGAAAFLLMGCLAPEALSVGAYSGGSGSATGEGGSAEGTTAGGNGSVTETETEGETEGEQPPEGFDGSSCETVEECVSSFDCEEVRCEDDRCVFEFHDELCEPGLTCTLGGCTSIGTPCEERYEGVLICDGFEQGISPQWTSVTVVTDASQASQGAISARVSALPGEGSMLRFGLDEPLVEGMLAVRSYVRVDDISTVDPWGIHHELMQIPSHPDMRMSLDLRSEGGLMVVNKVGSLTEVGGGLVTSGQWHCVELRVTIDDVEGTAEVRVDGEVVLAEEPGDTRPAEGFGRVGIGVLLPPQAVGPVELSVDDVVIATAPIGCD